MSRIWRFRLANQIVDTTIREVTGNFRKRNTSVGRWHRRLDRRYGCSVGRFETIGAFNHTPH